MVRPRSRQAFTLIEMMLVVVVIGVLSALILPGLGEALADNRQASAAEGLVRLHRVVLARVNQTGLAHLLMFNEAATSGHGDISVYEGMNNHCQTTPWAQVVANDALANGHVPVASLNMIDVNGLGDTDRHASSTDDDRQVITVRAAQLAAGGSSTPLSSVNLCVQPNGVTYLADSAGWTFQAQRASVLFTFHRSVNGLQHGVDRKVLFPVGGNARLRL